MDRKISFPTFSLLCLLAACSRVGDDAALPTQAGPDRPQASTQVASAPQPHRAPMPPPDALTDAAITDRIGEALRADPAMKGADVSVNTDRGVVVLSGTVRSTEQTGVASAHAQSQDGVVRVDNHLRPQLS